MNEKNLKKRVTSNNFLLFLRYCAELCGKEKKYEERNMLTLIIYKCEHKEELSVVETVVLILMSVKFAKFLVGFMSAIGG